MMLFGVKRLCLGFGSCILTARYPFSKIQLLPLNPWSDHTPRYQNGEDQEPSVSFAIPTGDQLLTAMAVTLTAAARTVRPLAMLLTTTRAPPAQLRSPAQLPLELPLETSECCT